MTRSKQARDPAQKAARRQVILDAAQALYQEHPLEDITISRVAREAGLAKGTLYLYFSTKEAIFMTLLVEHLSSWFGALSEALNAPGASPWTTTRLSALVAHQLQTRPILLRLISLTHLVLEKNLELETLIEFKRSLLHMWLEVAQDLTKHVPDMQPEWAKTYLLHLHAMVVGFGQMANSPPIMQEVLEHIPELALMEVDFESAVNQNSKAMLDALRLKS